MEHLHIFKMGRSGLFFACKNFKQKNYYVYLNIVYFCFCFGVNENCFTLLLCIYCSLYCKNRFQTANKNLNVFNLVQEMTVLTKLSIMRVKPQLNIRRIIVGLLFPDFTNSDKSCSVNHNCKLDSDGVYPFPKPLAGGMAENTYEHFKV